MHVCARVFPPLFFLGRVSAIVAIKCKINIAKKKS